MMDKLKPSEISRLIESLRAEATYQRDNHRHNLAAELVRAADALEELNCRTDPKIPPQLQAIEDANELIRALIRKMEPNTCDWCDGKNCETCSLCTEDDEDECNFSLAIDIKGPENKPLTLEQLKCMDNEPVWTDRRCGVVRADPQITRRPGIPAIHFNYGWEWADDVLACGPVYASKPEKEANNEKV